MQLDGLHTQVRAFSADTMFELGEQITNYLENWNKDFFTEEAYKPSYIKLVTVSHAVTVEKNPLPRLERYSNRKPMQNILMTTPFTTTVKYSAIGIFEIVRVTKEEVRKCKLLQQA